VLPVLLAGDSHVQGLAPRAEEVARALGTLDFSSEHKDGLAAADAAPWLGDVALRAGAGEVWVQLGTNDLETKAAFEAAVARVNAALSGAQVVWWGPPPASREPYVSAAERNALVLAGLGIDFVDARRYAGVQGLLDRRPADGVHYSARYYSAWAARAACHSVLLAWERDGLDLGGVPVELLVVLAEEESHFDPTQVSNAGATGVWQVTQVLLTEHNRRTGSDYRLRDMHDPLRCASVAAWYLREILDKLGAVGLAEDFQNAEYVGTVAAAYNAGLPQVAAIVRSIIAQGRRVLASEVVARTTWPERTFYAEVIHGFLRGVDSRQREAPTPEPVEPAPGGRSRGGTGALLLAGLGLAVGVAVVARKK